MLSIFHTFLGVNFAFNILRKKKMIKLKFFKKEIFEIEFCKTQNIN